MSNTVKPDCFQAILMASNRRAVLYAIHNNENIHFQVFLKKYRSNGTIIFPNDREFKGQCPTAWHFMDYSQAVKKLNEILK